MVCLGQFSSYRRDSGASHINQGSALGLSCLQIQGLCDLTPSSATLSGDACCPTRYQFSDHPLIRGTVMTERHWPFTDQKDALESPWPRGLRSLLQRLMIASSDTSSGHRTQKAVQQRTGPWSSESGWYDSQEQLCISLPEIRILTHQDTDDRWTGTRGGDKLNPSMKQYPKSGGRQLSLPSPLPHLVSVIHPISLASFSSASLVSASGS